MVRDEDGRLQSVTDNSMQPTTFKYDGDTNRVVKKGAGGETLYINPWYVAALGRNSKQIFARATRIATKLEISPTGEGYGPGAKNLKEVAQYFYHPDHLGSTGFATDATGEVRQHLEYFPFGETWVDEVSDDTRVPYRFTGKEFDQETKLYYYGARYYDPKTSAWQSPDPALGAFLRASKSHFAVPTLINGWSSELTGAGIGGMFAHQNLNGFGYVRQNPLKFVDPDGKCSAAAARFATAAVVAGGGPEDPLGDIAGVGIIAADCFMRYGVPAIAAWWYADQQIKHPAHNMAPANGEGNGKAEGEEQKDAVAVPTEPAPAAAPPPLPGGEENPNKRQRGESKKDFKERLKRQQNENTYKQTGGQPEEGQGSPQARAAQQKDWDWASKGLNKEEARALHEQITKKNLDKYQIRGLAEEIIKNRTP